MENKTVELTEDENFVLWLVANTTSKNVEWDKKSQEYRENSNNFIITLTKKEKAALTRAIDKLL